MICDTLVFLKANKNLFETLKAVLRDFSAFGGLEFNPTKCCMILTSSCVGVKDELGAIMGFQEGNLPLKYLEVPVIDRALYLTVKFFLTTLEITYENARIDTCRMEGSCS